jgi:hypothetical protein
MVWSGPEKARQGYSMSLATSAGCGQCACWIILARAGWKWATDYEFIRRREQRGQSVVQPLAVDGQERRQPGLAQLPLDDGAGEFDGVESFQGFVPAAFAGRGHLVAVVGEERKRSARRWAELRSCTKGNGPSTVVTPSASASTAVVSIACG